MNNPFWVEEEDSTPSTSRATKEKIGGSSKKKAVKRDKKVSRKKKALLSKSPFASESESDSDGLAVATTLAPKRKRISIVSDSECERRTPQQASGGSPPLGSHMLAMEVQKEARASPLPASAQSGASAQPAQPPQPQICAGCSKVITERYLLKALDQLWHEDCLKCGCCDCRLGEVGHTLYTRANLILCKRDYLRLFGNTGYCAACNKVIPAFEMVMRARSNVYHLECFACQQCNHRFCVGDRFYLCDNKILCEYDYEERLVFANMAYNPPPLAHLKRQTTHLPPPPTSNAMSGLMNGSSRSGDLNNNMSGSSPAPFAAPPHLKPLGLSASS